MNAILTTLMLSFVVILLVISGMSLGVMNGRKPISGSCGGVAGGGCELCSGSGKCRNKRKAAQTEN